MARSRNEIKPNVSGLTERLQALTEDLASQTKKFGSSLQNLKLEERSAPFHERLEELVVKHAQISDQIGLKIEAVREEDIPYFEELSRIAKDFHGRIEAFGTGLNKIDAWEADLEGLIGGGGSEKTSFNSLVFQYMEQINFLGLIVKQFGEKVKACECCMDLEKYETLIKSYEDVLMNWANLLKTVEDLLKSKKELFYNLAKNREDLLNSYEDLVKSALDVEDKRLDLLNKPMRKSIEFATSFEALAKSQAELANSLIVNQALPAKNTEDLLKSYEDLLKSIEDLIKSIIDIKFEKSMFCCDKPG
jgi:hypothetical protein